jgi:hypothetical protein
MANWKITIDINPDMIAFNESAMGTKELNVFAKGVWDKIKTYPAMRGFYEEFDNEDVWTNFDAERNETDDMDQLNFMLNELRDFADTNLIWLNSWGF